MATGPFSYSKNGARLVVRKMGEGTSIFLPGVTTEHYSAKVLRKVAHELGIRVSSIVVHKHPEHGMSGVEITRLAA